MRLEIFKQLNKKYGDSKFFQHIVREEIKNAEKKLSKAKKDLRNCQ